MGQLPDGTQAPHIDGYDIDCLLGAGGMGAVFMGRRHSDGLIVAIKIMRQLEKASKEMLSRTKREIEMSKSLAHPYLIKILDGGTIPGRSDYYLVMEFLVGEDLAAATLAKSLSEQRARHVALQMSEALSYAHSLHLIHRDIKPANIFITDEDRTVLLDFGLALASEMTRLTATGDVCGTFVYMAPEQLTGAAASAKSDIYSLGVTLYRAVTGTLPYEQDQLMAMCMGQKPPPPKSPKELREDLSQEFSDIIMRCMALAPGQRYPTAEVLKRKLLGEDEPITLTAETPLPQQDLSAALKPITEDSEIKSKVRKWPAILSCLTLALLTCLLLFKWSGEKKVSQKPVPKPTDIVFSDDVSPLRQEILHHSWPPTKEDCQVLGAVLKGAGVLTRMGIANEEPELAALFYLATYTGRNKMKKKSAEAFTLLVERYGPKVLPQIYPPIVSTMLHGNKYQKLSTQLAKRMDKAAEKAAPGPIRNRLQVIALKAKVDALAGKWQQRQELIPLRKEYEMLLGNKPKGVLWTDLTEGYCAVLLEEDTEESRDRCGEFAQQLGYDDELLSIDARIRLLSMAAGVLGGHYVNNEVKVREARHLKKALELTEKAFQLAVTNESKKAAGVGIDLAGRYRALGKNKEGLAVLERVDMTDEPQHLVCNYYAQKAKFLTDMRKYKEAHRLLRKARVYAGSERKVISIDDDIEKLKAQAAIDGQFLR